MKKRKGMTIVEVIIALLLMGLAFVVIGRLTGSRIEQTEALKYQDNLRGADGFMYNIYQDYHQCNNYYGNATDGPDKYEFSTGTGEDRVTKITFDMGLEGVHIYEYRVRDHMCYINNVDAFECRAFVVNGNEQFLYVSIQLDNGQRLEYQIYR